MNRRGFLAAAVAVVAALAAFGGLNVGVSDMCSDDPGRFYVPALTKVGHRAEVIPFCTDTNLLREAVRKFDLVLFTGGEDVNPARYGAAPSPKLGRMNLRRDEYEFALFAACVAERKPVFGICRGVQAMNVFFGGTLYQDIGSDYKLPEGAEAVRHGGLPFFNGATNPPLHSITATPGSRLGRVIGNTPLKVNSFHHQGVRDVAPGFRVAARSEDGFIEAIESSDYPAAGVQFHPEHTIYYRPDTGFEIDRFEDLMKHVMAFVDLKETSVPDHTANPSEVARFRDAAAGRKLFDPKFFGTPVMLASLARCDPDYNPEHGYWTGPAWPPTTYMTICGLKEYGFAKEAEEVAKRWYNGAYEIFLKTGTLWENWSPEQWDEQKGWAAKDFCGWTALAPIALPAEFGWGPTSR